MEVTPRVRAPVYQTTRATPMCRVILDNHTTQQRLSDFVDRYLLVDCFLLSMTRQFDASGSERLPNTP